VDLEDQHRFLTPQEIALNRLRLAALNALENGATPDAIQHEITTARQVHARTVVPGRGA
jgi:hypothetical protein